MKIFCLVCVLLPLALAGEKRFLLDNADLAKYVNLIADQVGSDATEQQCETACLAVMHSALLDTACPFICTSFQSLVQKFHLSATQQPAKRFLLDNADLAKYVNLIADQVGSDATEQQCETACLAVMHSALLDTACPFICTSFQSLVQKFHLSATQQPAKRFLLDNADLAKYVNLIADQVGSDATEQQCETACLAVMHSALLDTACPFICTSFQSLVQKFHLSATQQPAKRFLLDNADLAKYVNLIADQVGSDATEQQCETACLAVMHSALLDTACPFICTSFQSLVQKFHLSATQQPAKRFLLDNADLAKYVNLIADQVGSDATEQQCETACLAVMHSALLDTACPFICTSFQSLVQKFHLSATQQPAKRFLLDNADLAKYVNLIADQVGSDATEQQCETACLAVMHSALLDTACPFICTSFQSLVQKFHLSATQQPAKRFLLDNADLAKYVNLIADQVGSNATEQQCETACLEVMHSALLDTACPFICTSFQSLVQKFHLSVTQQPAKRFLLDNADLAKYVNLIADQVGSDATEQQCETACLAVMHSALLDTACPFICTSFQSLVQKFHLSATQQPAKRFLLDNADLAMYVNLIADQVGSDATEQQCETACLEVMHSALLDTACPFICTSFQSLVQTFHVSATQQPAKRFLLDNADLAKYVNLIADQVGSDATEQQCETACLAVMHSALLDTACPFICTSFQSLVQKFHLSATQQPAKRFLLDNADLAKYVNLIADQVGSDATEQQCETACLAVMHSALLDTACPFICTSFQSLVQKFHLSATQPPAKRFILDSLNLNNVINMFSNADLAKYVDLIVEKVGSDATEQQCETACLEVMHSDLLDTGCPFICTSFQQLVQKFHSPAQTAQPAKRFILDSLNLNNVINMFSNADLAKYVDLIVEKVGSDATEQQCETACLEVMHSDLLDTGCPFICTSFQQLVQKFHSPAQPAQRSTLH